MTQMNRHRWEIEKGWETKHKGDQRKIKDGVVCRWNTGTRSGEGANNSPNSAARLCWRSVKCLVSSICQKGAKKYFQIYCNCWQLWLCISSFDFFIPGFQEPISDLSLYVFYEIISWASYSKQAALKKTKQKNKADWHRGGSVWSSSQIHPSCLVSVSTCVNDSLYLDAGVVELLGEGVHGLQQVLAGLRVDVGPARRDFNWTHSKGTKS